jgi:hypothetical protein
LLTPKGLFSSVPGAHFVLVDLCRSLQIDVLPFSLDDPGTNLRGSFAFLMLDVRVVQLFQASPALRSVRAFEAAMQAVMTHAIAIAVTGLLMKNDRDLRSQLIGMRLVGILRVGAP